MSNKYTDLVQIIKQSRENIRPALQGAVFEREMRGSEVLKGEEAKIRALEELKQRPQVRITDLQQKKREVEEEVKEEEVKEDEEVKEEEEVKEDVDPFEEDIRRLIEQTTIDITGLKPKISKEKLVNTGIGKRYYEIFYDINGKESIVIFTKKSRKGVQPSIDRDKVEFEIPLIDGRLPLDIGKKKINTFISLLKKGKKTRDIIRGFKEFQTIEGRGFYDPRLLDPRLLIGAYLAKNNNKQLENLVLNKIF